MRKWRKMTWALLVWSVLMFALLLASKTYEAAGVLGLWLIGFAILGVIWYATGPGRKVA